MPTKLDARHDGLRESEHTALYRVPYVTSTPGSMGGSLTIYATSPGDAVARARAWHAVRPLSSRLRLTKTPRHTLTYGDAVRVGPEAGPNYWTRTS